MPCPCEAWVVIRGLVARSADVRGGADPPVLRMLLPALQHDLLPRPWLAEQLADLSSMEVEHVRGAVDHAVADETRANSQREPPQVGKDRPIDPVVVALGERPDPPGNGECVIKTGERVGTSGQGAPRPLD